MSQSNSTFDRDGGAAWNKLTSDRKQGEAFERGPEVRELHAAFDSLLATMEKHGVERGRDIVDDTRGMAPAVEAALNQATQRCNAAVERVTEAGMARREPDKAIDVLQEKADALQGMEASAPVAARGGMEKLRQGVADAIKGLMFGRGDGHSLAAGQNTMSGDALSLAMQGVGKKLKEMAQELGRGE